MGRRAERVSGKRPEPRERGIGPAAAVRQVQREDIQSANDPLIPVRQRRHVL